MKPLSDLLAEVEPNKHIEWSKFVEREHYDKLKAIAVELAEIIERIEENHILPRKMKDKLTTARKMLGDE